MPFVKKVVSQQGNIKERFLCEWGCNLACVPLPQNLWVENKGIVPQG